MSTMTPSRTLKPWSFVCNLLSIHPSICPSACVPADRLMNEPHSPKAELAFGGEMWGDSSFLLCASL